MGTICWMVSLAFQQLFPIQIFLIFLRFKLPPNFDIPVSSTDLRLGSSTLLFSPSLFISGIHKVPGIKFKGRYVVNMTGSCKGPTNKLFC